MQKQAAPFPRSHTKNKIKKSLGNNLGKNTLGRAYSRMKMIWDELI